jgi:uncharacterized protein (DUF952 family)
MGPLFHLAEPDVWAAACGTGSYEVSTRGRSLAEVGFIHMSFRHQVERVANTAYRDLDALVALVIDPLRLDAEVRNEAVGAETFPQLYGPLPVSAVVEVWPLQRGIGGWSLPQTVP